MKDQRTGRGKTPLGRGAWAENCGKWKGLPDTGRERQGAAGGRVSGVGAYTKAQRPEKPQGCM